MGAVRVKAVLIYKIVHSMGAVRVKASGPVPVGKGEVGVGVFSGLASSSLTTTT